VRRLVVDASIAVKWLNPQETLADKANLIRDDYAQGQVSLLVPAFWNYEVANGINKAVARGHLSEQEGRDAISLPLSSSRRPCAYQLWRVDKSVMPMSVANLRISVKGYVPFSPVSFPSSSRSMVTTYRTEIRL